MIFSALLKSEMAVGVKDASASSIIQFFFFFFFFFFYGFESENIYFDRWGLAERFIGWPSYSWDMIKWGLLLNIVWLAVHTPFFFLLQSIHLCVAVFESHQLVINRRYVIINFSAHLCQAPEFIAVLKFWIAFQPTIPFPVQNRSSSVQNGNSSFNNL